MSNTSSLAIEAFAHREAAFGKNSIWKTSSTLRKARECPGTLILAIRNS